MTLLRSLALIHTTNDLRLLVINLLVNLCTSRRLVSVHLGRQRRIVLASDRLGALDLATAIGGIVLIVGGRQTVGYAALIL